MRKSFSPGGDDRKSSQAKLLSSLSGLGSLMVCIPSVKTLGYCFIVNGQCL